MSKTWIAEVKTIPQIHLWARIIDNLNYIERDLWLSKSFADFTEAQIL